MDKGIKGGDMKKKAKFIRMFEDIEPEVWSKGDPKHERQLWHIITPQTVGSEHIWFGVICFPRGVSGAIHSHEYDETYFLLEGEEVVECDGKKYRMQPWDTMYFPAGVTHQIKNIGKKDAFHIWIYTPLPKEVSKEALSEASGKLSLEEIFLKHSSYKK